MDVDFLYGSFYTKNMCEFWIQIYFKRERFIISNISISILLSHLKIIIDISNNYRIFQFYKAIIFKCIKSYFYLTWKLCNKREMQWYIAHKKPNFNINRFFIYENVFFNLKHSVYIKKNIIQITTKLQLLATQRIDFQHK